MLKEWGGGNYKGVKLNELQEKLSNKKLDDDEQKKECEGWRDRLLEEKKKLEDEWGKMLCKLSEEKVNEQIV